MKKFIVCPVETEIDENGENRFFIRAFRYRGVSFSTDIPTHGNGVPKNSFAFAVLTQDVLNSVEDDVLIDKLPEKNPDEEAGLSDLKRQELNTKYGVNIPQGVKMRELVRILGKKFNQDFDETKWL